MFVNGDLRGKFIMDRNLGARDTKRAVNGKGILHYQYGRKDPFTTDFSSYYGANGYLGRGGLEDKWDTMTRVHGQTSISTSVATPMIFYSSDGWDNWAAAVDSATYLWNDFEEDYRDNGKSLFDPSPLGWKVAPHGTWADFDTKMTDWDSNTETMGRSYPSDNPIAYYPAHAYRGSTTGRLETSRLNTRVIYWASTPYSTMRSYTLDIKQIVITTDFERGLGCPLRCVLHELPSER